MFSGILETSPVFDFHGEWCHLCARLLIYEVGVEQQEGKILRRLKTKNPLGKTLEIYKEHFLNPQEPTHLKSTRAGKISLHSFSFIKIAHPFLKYVCEAHLKIKDL